MTDLITPANFNQKWADAFNAHDVPTLMSMYEPDAAIVPGPGADPIYGHAAIQANLEGFLALGGRLRFTPRFSLVQGDTALGSAAFTLDGGHDPDGNPIELQGITTEVIRCQPDGNWKYVIDHPFGGSD